MPVGTKLNKVPRNEKELNKLLQDIYVTAKQNYENDKESNLVAAIGATDDFKYATSSNILLQEIKNAPLKEWCVDTNVEVYL